MHVSVCDCLSKRYAILYVNRYILQIPISYNFLPCLIIIYTLNTTNFLVITFEASFIILSSPRVVIMAFDILDDFIHFVIWPHIMVYILYFVVKYLTLILEIIYYFTDQHSEADEENHSLFCLLTCCCFCCCCCNCFCCRYCCNCCNSAENLIKTIIKYNLKFDRWLIKLLLGREEGVVERHNDDYRSDEDSEGKVFAPIYIRNKSLTSTEVSILSTLVFTFGLLISITAFDIYFLDVSYACTDDNSFSCFVLPVNADSNRSELGITNERISSCSPWENTNISDQVYVVCYKWIYNFKE